MKTNQSSTDEQKSVSASWMPLLWLQDSTSGTEASFIKNKPERFMDVPSLPLTGEWPWLDSLWWHCQFITWLIPAPWHSRVTCPSQLSSSRGLCLTHCSQQCLLLLLQGCLELFSKQLAPARDLLESCKGTAGSCCLRNWSEGEADRGQRNHLPFTHHVQPAFSLIIQILKTQQTCRWYQQVL